MRIKKSPYRHSERSRNLALPNSGFDKWAATIGHLSQPCLVAVAIIVYVYTVIPVYQKSLLDEEIARKELQLKEAGKKLDAMETRLAEVTPMVKAIETKLTAAEKKLTTADAELRSARVRQTVLYEDLRTQVVLDFVGRVMNRCS